MPPTYIVCMVASAMPARFELWFMLVAHAKETTAGGESE
jgi:hypothetical protein